MNAQDKLIKYMFLKIQAVPKTYLIGTHSYSLNILPGLWKTQEFQKKLQLSHSKKTKKPKQKQRPSGSLFPNLYSTLFLWIK